MNKDLIISLQARRKAHFIWPYLTVKHCLLGNKPLPDFGLPVMAYSKNEINQWSFFFHSQKESKNLPKEFYNNFLEKKYIDIFDKQIQETYQKGIGWLSKKHDMEDYECYKKGMEYFGFALRCMMIIRMNDLANMELLKKSIKDEDELALISLPKENSYSLDEEIELLTTNDLEAHAKKWQWISLGYHNEKPLELQDFQERIDIVENKEACLQQIQNDIKIRLAQQQKIIKKYDKQTQWLIHNIQEAVYLKDFLKKFFNEGLFWFNKVFDKIDQRFFVESRYYKPSEIKLLLEENKKVNEEIIKKRQELCIIFPVDGEAEVIYDREAREWENEFFAIKKTSQNEWQGRTVSPGKTKGQVRILLSGETMTSFKNGEILITNNTTPDFVPVMKKAKAVITEEGGLTSHAALISRELGIPCIVGIEHIASYLRDGDFIEVDADNGIVRRL